MTGTRTSTLSENPTKKNDTRSVTYAGVIALIFIIVAICIGTFAILQMNSSQYAPITDKHRFYGVEKRISTDERIQLVEVGPAVTGGRFTPEKLRNERKGYRAYISIKPEFAKEVKDVAADAVETIYANGNFDGGADLKKLQLYVWVPESVNSTPFEGEAAIDYYVDLRTLKD